MPRLLLPTWRVLAALALWAAWAPGPAQPRPTVAAAEPSDWLYWHRVCAACVRQFSLLGPRALAIDGAGRQHLAYGGKGLYYATAPAGGAWQFTLVDGGRNVGAAAALALKTTGQPGIAYHDPAAGWLRYAEWTGSAWVLEDVAPAPADLGQSGRFSLAFDPANQPAIAYFDPAAADLRYAWRSAGQWQSQAVDTAGDVGATSSLAFDRAGNPAISYADATGRTLKLARRAGGAWVAQVVGPGGQGSALAFDADNQPHIAHSGWDLRSLDYTRWTGSAWASEPVLADNLAAERDLSLALDSQRQAHIGYRDRNDRPAYALRATNGAWTHSFAPGQAAVGAALALAPEGAPRLAFMADDGVLLAQPDAGAWPLTVVDPFAGLPDTPSLGVDGADGVHLLYKDDAGQHYGRLAGGAWLTSTVALGARKGVLALDSAGGPHALYEPLYDRSGTLEYARLLGGAWQTSTVSGQFTGRPALAVADPLRPSAVYWAANSRDLIYAAWSGSAWETQTIASPIDTRRDVALALDASGFPHVAYSTLGGRLSYLQWNGSGWLTTTLEISGVTGLSLDLALDAGSRPHLGYYAGDSRALTYARFDGNQWQKEPVVTFGPAETQARFSFALDGAGAPHFTYYDPADGHLRYARRLEAGWAAESLGFVADSGAAVEYLSSLALAPDGHVHVAYVHSQRGILYAEGQPGWRAFLPGLSR